MVVVGSATIKYKIGDIITKIRDQHANSTNTSGKVMKYATKEDYFNQLKEFGVSTDVLIGPNDMFYWVSID